MVMDVEGHYEGIQWNGRWETTSGFSIYYYIIESKLSGKLRAMFKVILGAEVDAKLTTLQSIHIKKVESFIEYSNRIFELVSKVECTGHAPSNWAEAYITLWVAYRVWLLSRINYKCCTRLPWTSVKGSGPWVLYHAKGVQNRTCIGYH